MNILLVVVFVLPSLLYLLAWRRARGLVATASAAPEPAGGAAPGGQGRMQRLGPWVPLGLLVHALSLAFTMSGVTLSLSRDVVTYSHALHFGFAAALSVTFWLGVLILWVESLRVRVEALQMVVMPVAAVAVLLPLFFPGMDLSALAHLPLFVPHLLVGTLAYGVLLLAALHAGLMMAAERALHDPSRLPRTAGFAAWLDQLPPLLVLERILFRFIWSGFGMLTLTALSGILFSEQVVGKPLRFDHKTVFTLLAWLLIGVLLLGRRQWGWRGRTALRLTMSGFVVLMLAYVGSHFVREVILQRY